MRRFSGHMPSSRATKLDQGMSNKPLSKVLTPMQVDHVQAFESPIKTERAVWAHGLPELFGVTWRMNPLRVDFGTKPPKEHKSCKDRKEKLCTETLTRKKI